MARNTDYSMKFVPLNELLLDDNEKVREITTIYQKESEYSDILFAIEWNIAQTFLDDKNLNDKDAINALKNIKSGYYNGLDYFESGLEKSIMLGLSTKLQKRPITKHEFFLCISYVLWSIDNRSHLPSRQAYLLWLLKFFNVGSQEHKQDFEKMINGFGKQTGASKEAIERLKTNDFSGQKIDLIEEGHSLIESQLFAMDEEHLINGLQANPELKNILLRAVTTQLRIKKYRLL